jgi:hypothetical protein
MFLFALLLPVILGFLGLAMAASMLLDARAKLDEASLSSAVAAASDACMSSPYAFDLLACSHHPTTSYPAAWTAPGATSATLPPPLFTSSNGTYTPNTVTCSDLVTPPNDCVEREWAVAQDSAADSVSQVLAADYPNLGTPVSCPQGNTAAQCLASLTSSNIVFQAKVSYWFYYDSDDVGGAVSTECSTCYNASSDRPPDDIYNLAGLGPNSCPNSCPGDANPAGDGDGDAGPVPPAAPPAHLVCPVTYGTYPGPPVVNKAQFARQITVNVWLQSTNPFSGVVGLPNTTMESSVTTYGCSRQ